MKKTRGIRWKLLRMSMLPMLILGLIVTVICVSALKTTAREESLTALHFVCQSTKAAYDGIARGDYFVGQDGVSLYKGSVCISLDTDLLDSFVEGTDAEVTVFFGDTRMATTLLDKETGKRIVGTQANADVVEAVLNRGEHYQATDVVINGENYYAYYMPLTNSDGSVVGMIFAGQPSTDVDQKITESLMMVVGVFIATLLIAGFYVIMGARKIGNAVSHASGVLDELSKGNLMVDMPETVLKRNDEIGAMGNAMKKLLEELQGILGGIKDSTVTLMDHGESLESMAAQTSSTADEVSNAVEDISKGAVSMAEDVEDATLQVTNMGVLIEKIVESVKELDQLADSMHKADLESAQIIQELGISNDQTIEAIRKIEQSVHNTNESAAQIQEAVSLISSIADETSLLALNASIEAARAGEAGRGFAVVATQISKLSEDSNESAKSIENIVAQLAADSEKSVKIMNEVDEIVALQQEKLNETRNKFNDVTVGIEGSMKEMQVISGQAAECDEDRGKVMEVIQSLSAVSEENAASTEETTASMEELNATMNLLANSAKELKDISQRLKTEVEFFKF